MAGGVHSSLLLYLQVYNLMENRLKLGWAESKYVDSLSDSHLAGIWTLFMILVLNTNLR